MATSAGVDLVENGLVLSLDPLTSSTYPKNVHPKPTDIFGWFFDNGGRETVAVNDCRVYKDTTITSPVGGNPLAMYITGKDPHIGCYNTPAWNIYPAAFGQTWTISVYAKASRPGGIGDLFLFGAPANGNVFDATFGEITGTNITFTTDWQRFSYTYTFTKPVSFIQLRLDGIDTQSSTQDAIGQTVWWDGLQVENQSSMTAFDSTRTTTAAIIDRFGNVIIPVNTPTIVNDTITFDGVNDYLRLANELYVYPSQGFAIGMWIRQGATQASSTWNYFLRSDYPGNVFELGSFGTSSGNFAFKDNGINVALVTPNISTGYNYVVFGTDNNRLPYMYTVNASGTTTATSTSQFTNFPLNLKQLFGGFFSNSYYKCDIKLLQVYNRDLSATEVSQNFNALRSRFGI